MRRVTMVGLCLVAALSISALAVATASAAEEAPEFGRCIKKEGKPAGKGYSDAGCITSVETGAKYEWAPGPGADPHFTITARYKPGPITKHCETAKRDEEHARKKREEAEIAELKGELEKAATLRAEAAKLEEKAKKQREASGISIEECEKLIEDKSEGEEAVVLETESGTAVECSSLSGEGEYTGTTTVGNLTTKFTGCELAETEVACQSSGAKAGEILPATLHGELGFDKHEGSPNKSKVGVALSAESSTIAEFTCGAFAISVTGSVIHDVTTDKMLLTETEKVIQHNGEQVPERFEGGPLRVLTAHLGELSEQAGMGLLSKLTNGEKMEVNAAV